MASAEDIVTRRPPTGRSWSDDGLATAELVIRVDPAPVPATPGPERQARPRSARHLGEVFAAVAVAALLAVGLMLFGPPGVDRAAHLHHTQEFARYGWRVWDNYWYAGRYEIVNYSILYYPLAALLGEAVVVLSSLLGSVALFAVMARTLVGRDGRWASLAFAVTLPTLLIAGQYPFALGVLFALGSLVLLQRRQHLVAVVAALATILASPLAFLLLGIVLVGVAAGRPEVLRRRRSRRVGAAIVLLTLGEIGLLRLFPSGGHFPYPVLDLTGILLLSVAGVAASRRARLRGVDGVFAVYGAAGLALFVFPSSVGGNVARLLDYFSLPMLLLVLAPVRCRPRVLATAALTVATLWQAIPVARDLRGGLEEKANAATFWSGSIEWLQRHSQPDYRVEVVPTWGHWEAFHFAKQDIPITRGWFRQDDTVVNQAFYTDDLDARTYETWLRSLGVRYVVLPNERLDYSARIEAQILRLPDHGGLKLRYVDANTQIFELPKPTPMVTSVVPLRPSAPGTRTGMVVVDRTQLVLFVAAPGVYDVRVNYTPYWHPDGDGVCLTSAGPTGMTRLYAQRAGLVRISFDFTSGRATGQALGRSAPSCATPAVGASRAERDGPGR